MDAQNQFIIFSLCIAVGFVGGLIYEIFAFIRWIFGCERGKNKVFGGILDFLFFVSFAIFCIIASFALHFSGFRVYMWLGFGLGGTIYSKTLRRIVAFLENMCYNLSYKIIIKAKARKNSLNRGMDI